ncbi:MFS transporter [Lactiplantibacillus xiangfangensis]|uniref:Cyanate permease n=1 Tax=Lactiplantibacillus xiangfangensis TaxID=942150 RepID=A0A0R2M2H7_9LACO|nr:MFS transporter [Lactiplantibacillus xiangfangensis]KRO07735.1 cyanate permease [Lactiplantibacillus xiangfangensis]
MQRRKGFTALGIVLVAINMRLPITAIPPILPNLQQASGLSATVAGLLTSIPLLTFAIFSSVFTKASQRWGEFKVLLIAFIILSCGAALRILPQVTPLLLGTFLIGLGIDGGNVIIPAVIKDRLPNRPTLGVSLYTTAMVLMSSLATGIVGPLTAKFSLTTTMVVLFVLSLISVIGCLLLTDRHPADTVKATNTTAKLPKSIWTDQLAWLITLFFGIQALLYYSLVTWLPNIFQTVGYDANVAAMLVTILQLACLACALLTPIFASSKLGKQLMLWIIGIGFGLGTIGVYLPLHTLAFGVTLALLMGVASGFSFNLAIIFFTQKTSNPSETIEVSGMAQTFGYLFAAAGPFSFGLLKSWSGSWLSTLLSCLVLAIAILVIGFLIERHTNVFQ